MKLGGPTSGDQRGGGEYRPRNGSISTRSRLKPRLGAAAEAAGRRQFTDRAEPRVYSRLFRRRNVLLQMRAASLLATPPGSKYVPCPPPPPSSQSSPPSG